jgi:hypothetical protein
MENTQKQTEKEYRLAKWYPSLPEKWKNKEIVVNNGVGNFFQNLGGIYHYEGFHIDSKIVENNPEYWELVEEKHQPLLITEDGKEIFEGDKYYTVCYDYTINKNTAFKNKTFQSSKLKRFSTHEAAEAYVKENEKKFSEKQIIDAANRTIFKNGNAKDFYKELGI